MSIASAIRTFWDDLFYSALVDRLETDLLMARSDLQQLRQDKDQTIAELRSEKAQLTAAVALYQVNINARVGIDPTRKKPEKPSFASFVSPQVKTSWQAQVEKHEEQIAKELEEEEAAAK
jgi:outer membrane protein TolC